MTTTGGEKTPGPIKAFYPMMIVPGIVLLLAPATVENIMRYFGFRESMGGLLQVAYFAGGVIGILAITGASGAPYAVRLLEVLATHRVPTWLIISGHGQRLLALFHSRFGEHLPLIRREDVRGFIKHRPIWLQRPLSLKAARKQAAPASAYGHKKPPHSPTEEDW